MGAGAGASPGVAAAGVGAGAGVAAGAVCAGDGAGAGEACGVDAAGFGAAACGVAAGCGAALGDGEGAGPTSAKAAPIVSAMAAAPSAKCFDQIMRARHFPTGKVANSYAQEGY